MAHCYPPLTNSDTNTWGYSYANPHCSSGARWTSTYRYAGADRYTRAHGRGTADGHTCAYSHAGANGYTCPYRDARAYSDSFAHIYTSARYASDIPVHGDQDGGYQRWCLWG